MQKAKSRHTISKLVIVGLLSGVSSLAHAQTAAEEGGSE